MFSSFTEALDGASTIRVARMEGQFTDSLLEKLDANARAYFLQTSINRWSRTEVETRRKSEDDSARHEA